RGDVVLGLAPCAVRLDHGMDLRALLRELAIAVEVVHDLGIGEPCVDLLQAGIEARQLPRDRVLHGLGSPSSSGSGERARAARARPRRSPSAACDRAGIGWWRSLLASPRANDSSTASGSSPFARRARARTSSDSR